jgi:hypothetical protein
MLAMSPSIRQIVFKLTPLMPKVELAAEGVSLISPLSNFSELRVLSRLAVVLIPVFVALGVQVAIPSLSGMAVTMSRLSSWVMQPQMVLREPLQVELTIGFYRLNLFSVLTIRTI